MGVPRKWSGSIRGFQGVDLLKNNKLCTGSAKMGWCSVSVHDSRSVRVSRTRALWDGRVGIGFSIESYRLFFSTNH